MMHGFLLSLSRWLERRGVFLAQFLERRRNRQAVRSVFAFCLSVFIFHNLLFPFFFR